ncbi:phosphatase PAP2 family protein [Alloscardovia theropitheci]|uniref:Phosphatase PAP2 family protein n=1 Tax=Alloscardovia theropitheci TaxID=2496842 RepID=A0A4R0QXW5_9BIFI|nr:phosphatase PAP2 family protein [Alloscardovia theropitheci]TCD54530.1 phosphatase PAP2 family protein [Alloscardovia theropitheci]
MADDKNFLPDYSSQESSMQDVLSEKVDSGEKMPEKLSSGKISKKISEKASSERTFTVRIDRGSDQYLATHPRVSSVVWAIILGIIGLLSTAVVYYVGVWTQSGQYFDDWMWSQMGSVYPNVDTYMPVIFTNSIVIIAISITMIALSLITVIARKRFYTFGIIIVFIAVAFAASYSLKRLLPRPVFDSLMPNPANSAPSGHTALTMIAGVALVMGMPRVLRAIASLWSMIFTTMVGIMVIYDGWHRPTDPLTSIMLVGSLGLIAMAFTRASGMDEPGTRKSSISVQIVSTILIVFGLASAAYGTYIVSQIYPVVQYQPEDLTVSGLYSTFALIVGMSSFLYGCVLAIRQVTAAPLSRLGLVGAPPAPPVSSHTREF